MKKILSAALILAAATNVNAQFKIPAPSPLQTIKQNFALSDITIEYSRPSAKNRVVYGDLVPFDKVWRTGANASTKVIFGEDVKVEGMALPSGTYALYTIPGKESWQIMFYKDLTLGGSVNEYKTENEAARITVKSTTLCERVETMTFDMADISSTKATIRLDWENTRVSFNVSSEIDDRVMKSIDKALEKDTRPYFQAASYYFDNNKDLAKASEWVDKAIEGSPKAYYMYLLKGKIKAKQGDKKGAVAAAQQTITLAKEQKNDDYVKMGEKLLAENK
jgi:tetratricopeptide (TPR) repeat protein